MKKGRVILFALQVVIVSGATIENSLAQSNSNEMALLPSGNYIPLYAADKKPVDVKSFYLDVYPVTNKQFYEFVITHPQWAKESMKEVFADGNYLSPWKNILLQVTDPDFANAPVTNISWFAAKNYCSCQGKRLPSTDEWEYAASASELSANSSSDSSFYQYILDWYSKPTPEKFDRVGSTYKNYYGVYDLHGLVWEWTLDFNSMLLNGDSRNLDDSMNAMFCGAAAAGSADLKNYAAFMRFAFRSSLEGNYTVKILGFRCAKNSDDVLAE